MLVTINLTGVKYSTTYVHIRYPILWYPADRKTAGQLRLPLLRPIYFSIDCRTRNLRWCEAETNKRKPTKPVTRTREGKPSSCVDSCAIGCKVFVITITGNLIEVTTPAVWYSFRDICLYLILRRLPCMLLIQQYARISKPHDGINQPTQIRPHSQLAESCSC